MKREDVKNHIPGITDEALKWLMAAQPRRVLRTKQPRRSWGSGLDLQARGDGRRKSRAPQPGGALRPAPPFAPRRTHLFTGGRAACRQQSATA